MWTRNSTRFSQIALQYEPVQVAHMLPPEAVPNFLAAYRQKEQRSLADMYAAWYQHSSEMREARQAAQVMSAKTRRSHFAITFHAWQQDTAHAQRVLQAAHSMMSRTQHASQVYLQSRS